MDDINYPVARAYYWVQNLQLEEAVSCFGVGAVVGEVGLRTISELKCSCSVLARMVWVEAGIGFDRAVESLRSIWGATERGGVSPPLNVLT